MIVRNINKQNKDLKIFVDNLSISSDTFTYFKSRCFDALDNHTLTALGYVKNSPVAYGHLDKDGDTVWLGICVVGSEVGKGYGKKMMEYLTEYADKNKINLKLSVHRFNIQAVNLYKKFNFIKTSESDKSFYFTRPYLNN